MLSSRSSVMPSTFFDNFSTVNSSVEFFSSRFDFSLILSSRSLVTSSTLVDNLATSVFSVVFLSFISATSFFTASSSTWTAFKFVSNVFFSLSSFWIFSLRVFISLSFDFTVICRLSFCSLRSRKSLFSFSIASSFLSISFLSESICLKISGSWVSPLPTMFKCKAEFATISLLPSILPDWISITSFKLTMAVAMLPREQKYEHQTGRLNHWRHSSIYGVGVPKNLIHLITSSLLLSSLNNHSPFRHFLFFFFQKRQYRSTR